MTSWIFLLIGAVFLIAAIAHMHNDIQSERHQRFETRLSAIDLKVFKVTSTLDIAQCDFNLLKIRADKFDSELTKWLKLVSEHQDIVSKENLEVIKELQIMREQHEKLREDQIQMRENFAKLRPLIKMPSGAIQIEILPGSYKPKGNMGKKK